MECSSRRTPGGARCRSAHEGWAFLGKVPLAATCAIYDRGLWRIKGVSATASGRRNFVAWSGVLRPAAWGSGGRHREISAEPVAILRIAVLVFGVEAARFECRAAPRGRARAGREAGTG